MTARPTDDELAAQAAAGDRRAYAGLVRHYAPALAQAARGFGLPDTDVDDAVQEAFVAVWRRLGEYDPTRPFRPWLFRIALNKMRDLRRYRRVRSFLFGANPLEDAAPAHLRADDADPERDALARAELTRTRAVLDGLDRELREALVLTAIVGLSHPEAAQALNTTTKAIEGRVARARRQLAQRLEEKSAEPEGASARPA